MRTLWETLAQPRIAHASSLENCTRHASPADCHLTTGDGRATETSRRVAFHRGPIFATDWLPNADGFPDAERFASRADPIGKAPIRSRDVMPNDRSLRATPGREQ